MVNRDHLPARLLHVFPTFAPGGVPLRMCEMMNRLGGRFHHTVIALNGAVEARRALAPSTIVDFPSLDVDKNRPIAAFLTFARTLRRMRPDLLLTYNWGAVEWGLVDRFLSICPHIHFESGFGPEEADRQIPRRVLFRRIALARSAAVVVPSRNLLRIATNIWRLDAARLQFVPNGVDLSRFGAPPAAGLINGFSKAPGELIVGTVAPLRAEKNIHRLIRAFAVLPAKTPARLLIVGDGSERPALEAAAAALGVAGRVVFAGHIDRPEQVLGWLDIFAISSDTEQMPNALIQAMAASRAVVGVDVGDVKEIVAPPNRRFVVARADETGFADAIATLLSDDALRAELGRANRAHVEATYDIEVMVERYRALFEGALAGSRDRPRPVGEGLRTVSDPALPR